MSTFTASEMARPSLSGERVGDRAAETAFDRFLREVTGGREQRGAVEQTDGAGHAHPGTLLGGQGPVGQFAYHLFPDDTQVVLVLRHLAGSPPLDGAYGRIGPGTPLVTPPYDPLRT